MIQRRKRRDRRSRIPAFIAILLAALTAGTAALFTGGTTAEQEATEPPAILTASAPVLARVGSETHGLYNDTPEPQTTNVRLPEPPAEITTEPVLSWNPETHQEGYCEGYCHESICPYFDGYPAYIEPPWTGADIEMIAKMVCGEARGCTPDEQRLVVWTVLQRIDRPDEYGDTIKGVITAPRQFIGYHAGNPVDPDIAELVAGELMAWWRGFPPPTLEPYAPNAPYYYFDGDGRNNWFREAWRP